MKIQIEFNSSDVSRRARRAASMVAVPLVLAAGVAWAAVPHRFISGDVVSSAMINENFDNVAPPGTVVAFAGSTAPDGWLLCNGGVVNRTAYPALFGVIGTDYGAGDGATTFTLPDLRGRGVMGAGQGSGLTNRTRAQALGAESRALSAAELPAHSHAISDPGHRHSTPFPGQFVIWNGSSGPSYVNGPGIPLTSDPYTTFAATGITGTQSTGGGASFGIVAPTLVMNYIIRY